MPRPKEFDPVEAVDAAMRTFAARGYEATSAQDLCESTGLNRSSLYNTFESKQALYSRCLDRYAELQSVKAETLLDGEGSGYDRIRAMLLATVEDELLPDANGCLITRTAVELAQDPVSAETVRRLMEQLIARLATTISCGQSDGSIGQGQQATALARFVHSAISGVRVQGRVGAPRELLLDIVEVTCTALRP